MTVTAKCSRCGLSIEFDSRGNMMTFCGINTCPYEDGYDYAADEYLDPIVVTPVSLPKTDLAEEDYLDEAFISEEDESSTEGWRYYSIERDWSGQES